MRNVATDMEDSTLLGGSHMGYEAGLYLASASIAFCFYFITSNSIWETVRYLETAYLNTLLGLTHFCYFYSTIERSYTQVPRGQLHEQGSLNLMLRTVLISPTISKGVTTQKYANLADDAWGAGGGPHAIWGSGLKTKPRSGDYDAASEENIKPISSPTIGKYQSDS